MEARNAAPWTARPARRGCAAAPGRVLLWLLYATKFACPLTPKGARAAGVKARGNSRTKRAKSAAPPVSAASFKSKESGLAPDVIGALDFECTCEPGWDYIHEIIEFPVVLFDTRTREITDSFHSYVRPTENATLSAFCTDLTGIEQATVDAAPSVALAVRHRTQRNERTASRARAASPRKDERTQRARKLRCVNDECADTARHWEVHYWAVAFTVSFAPPRSRIAGA